MQTSRTMIIFHMEIIELIISNIHLVTRNRVIIIGYMFKIGNKGPDEFLVS